MGQPGAGKTTLVVDLVRELCSAGLSVGTIKHSAHAHELDKPGKDSFRHREAGASPVAMMNRHMAAVYLPGSEGMTPDTLLAQFYTHLDLVLIEGWISGPYPKIEIWREVVGRPPLFKTVPGGIALAVDGPIPREIREAAVAKGLACFPRQDVPALAKLLLTIPS